MRYGSVCSGIEAASVAWRGLGWECSFLSEIEKFPRAVLSHHYPSTPLHGDFTTIKAGAYEPIDLLVGGTPCQSFSIAGLRGGMDDERGNLALEFLKLAERLQPRWILWENVPGVLSSTNHDAPDPCTPPNDLDVFDGREWVGEDEYDADENHAFACFLAGLSEIGYGFAYRILDAQFFGLAQRRERVFVVGYLGDWRCAAAVLFEPESLRRNPPPSRAKGQRITPTITRGSPSGGRSPGLSADDCDSLVSMCLNAHPNRMDGESQTFVTHALTANGFDASEDGTGRGTPIVATMRANGDAHSGFKDDDGLVPVMFAQNTRDELRLMEVSGALASQPGMKQTSYAKIGSAVRRLTPRECERLQGFPDDYTAIPYRGKIAADGPRYKALGNSMAVPVMRKIGQRIDAMERAIRARSAA